MKSYRYSRKKNNNIAKLIGIFSIISLIVLFLNMDNIDREPPSIFLKYDEVYVGKNKNIYVKIKDNINIANYKVVLSDGDDYIVLEEKSDISKKEIILDIEFPKIDLFFKKDNATLTIEAKDSSWWNFIMRDKAIREVPLIFDDIAPQIKVISTTKYIKKGGSGIVVFSIKEDNLEDVHIRLGENLIFKPTKFYKDGNYVSLMVWDVQIKNINPVIVATDKAGNKTIKSITIRKNIASYRKSKIKLKNKFLDKKITNLYKELRIEPKKAKKIEKFVNINEKQRKLNSRIILANSKKVRESNISSLSLNAFAPLKGYATVGSFGVFRKFFYKNSKVSESYHLGIDMASVRNDSIKTTNDGEVVFTDNVGIYGNSLILYHKLGIYSLYSHCSELFSYQGKVKQGDIIAKTGQTGLAMGDHLHFSIIIQGVFARPSEWLSQKWIDSNIISILDNAKQLIDKN